MDVWNWVSTDGWPVLMASEKKRKLLRIASEEVMALGIRQPIGLY